MKMEKTESDNNCDRENAGDDSKIDSPNATPNKLTKIILHLEEIDTNLYRYNI